MLSQFKCLTVTVYVGTTKRKLGIRVDEHKKALNSMSINSNVADHAFNTKHNINFESPQIIYSETNYKARSFLESWNIEEQKFKGIPLMNDQQNSKSCIPSQYLGLMY